MHIIYLVEGHIYNIVRNCQIATTGSRPVDLLHKYITQLKCYIQNPVKICQSAELDSDPRLWLVSIFKQALYVACNIYNVVMPLVMHEATSLK